ncbi:MAG: hypothetical protein CMQ14_05325, partial [Gammaproteobacteria bacterium]|nr:hypothetical protein [Gammaproteobacteria bacterium]
MEILLHQLAKADTFLQIHYDDHLGAVVETGSNMKQFIDFIPLLIFFTVWAMDERSVTIGDVEHSVGGIFSAAEFLLAGSILVYGCLFAAQRRLDKFQWITVAAVVLFCIPTIIFRDTNFL